MQKQTIALIDDDRNILTSLSIALEKEGFKVQTYLDGESALIGLTRQPPDLAIIDIKMPKMDGEELLKKLRKKTTLPVIFLTSKDDEIDELLGLKLATNEFVAYIQLGELEPEFFSDRTKVILLYALCGFANFSSVGILISGIGAMAPERTGDLIDVSVKALI